MALTMRSSRTEFHLLHIYREGMLTTAYRAADLARTGALPSEIARPLKRQAFREEFGPHDEGANDNGTQQT
jgi:hypothetical protein